VFPDGKDCLKYLVVKAGIAQTFDEFGAVFVISAPGTLGEPHGRIEMATL
jgi:hypothetical protein